MKRRLQRFASDDWDRISRLPAARVLEGAVLVFRDTQEMLLIE